jgi:hypothetical protein
VVTVNSKQERKKVEYIGALDEIKCGYFWKDGFGLRVRSNPDELRRQWKTVSCCLFPCHGRSPVFVAQPTRHIHHHTRPICVVQWLVVLPDPYNLLHKSRFFLNSRSASEEMSWLLWNREVHFGIQVGQPLAFIQSQTNPIHNIQRYLFNMY